jgi:ribosome production factor 2
MAPTPHQAKTAKAKLISGGKQPKARIARYLKTTESQLVEGAKTSLLLRGIRCSDAMSSVLKDMRSVQAPHAKMLSKNNMILPFDDTGQQSLEFLTTKNDAALFAVASHNKKRPNNLIMGRTFDRRVLDMVEIGILQYRSLADFGGLPKKRLGSKPLIQFVGDSWSSDVNLKRLQNLLIDFYRGDPIDSLVLSGLDHVMVFTAAEAGTLAGGQETRSPIIHQRTYYMKLKKDHNGGKAPVPYLTPSGPDMDFKVRRTQFASPDLWKLAMKQPAGIKAKKKKNQTTNIFGETIGRLHLEKQDIDSKTGKKSKALRLADRLEKQEEKAAIESELGQEQAEMSNEFKQAYGFAPDMLIK